MIISKIKGNNILTFSGCLDMIGYFIALIFFWAIVIILFSLFMGWFLEVYLVLLERILLK